MISLPEKIEDAVYKVLDNRASKTWLKKAASLSLKYRTQRKQSIRYISDFDEALGYLALRTPSTYSQIYGALSTVSQLNPSWKPKSILDIGSGPGTAIWAAREIFPTLETGCAVERDKNFIAIGKTILESFSDIEITWQTVDLVNLPESNEKFDLVILANILNEMAEEVRNKTIKVASNRCSCILIIVEPGTPYGFECIKQASKQLDSLQNILVAPYVENSFIPSDRVSFAERIKRPDFQKRVRQLQRKQEHPEKKGLLPPSDWEESKYYYLASSKFKPEISPFGRLIEKPKLARPFIELEILTKEGLKTKRVFKKDRAKYKLAKKLKWGDILMSIN